MYYFLLCFAAVLYALAFYCNRNAERTCSDGINTAALFSAVVWLETLAALCVVILGVGQRFEFSWFSFICAVAQGAVMVTFTFLNFKALGIVDLAKYSMFTMLGGMLVPFFFGIIFMGEKLTLWKIICCVLVTFALWFDSKSGKLTKRALGYLIGVFFVNGLFGVVTTLHQRGGAAVGSLQFMALQSAAIFVCASLYLLIKRAKKGASLNIVKNKKAYGFMALYGVMNSSAELILLFAIKHVDASVQYPIITGGVIVFSTVISMLIGENKNKASLIPVGVAFLGLLCLVL